MSTLVTTALRHNASASNNMVLDSNGRVGIGTAAPGAAVDIVNSGLPFRLAAASSSGYALLQLGQSATASQNWHIGSEGDGTFRWYNGNFGAGTERMRIDSAGLFQFNSGFGSVATAFGCRAWVNFNGTGVVAIRASGNVSSITDNGTGDYTVNFTSAMPDANFCTVANGRFDEANTLGAANIGVCMARQTSGQTTSSSRVVSFATSSGSALDFLSVAVAIFR